MAENNGMANGKETFNVFLKRLTNLSGNNRSLLLLRLSAEQLVDLHDLHFLSGAPSFEIINQLIGGSSSHIAQVLDSRMEENNVVSRKLKRLKRLDKFIYEERGSNDLHVGWPFVHGKFSDGSSVRCPLIFFPVRLEEVKNQWILKLRPDAGINFNKTFLLAYAHYNRVTISEDLLDISFDDFSKESLVFRTQLYEFLKDRLELNFNRETFQDQLQSFQVFKKEEYDKQHKAGELKLFPEAVLGLFPQAGSQMVPDYLKLMEEVDEVEDLFLKVQSDQPGKAFPDGIDIMEPTLREEKKHTAFPIDSFQESAMDAVKLNHSIVVQGPPGTGKSQLICNLITDAIASGRKVLVVCQKRAALDVVFNRLSKIELKDFVGLVHDFRNDRKNIYLQIGRQIENLEGYAAQNRSVDTIQAERKFLHVCRSVDQAVESLDEFKEDLFNENECGVSIKELYLGSDPNGEYINLKQEYQYFKIPDLNPFLNKIVSFCRYSGKYENKSWFWNQRKAFSQFTFRDLKEIDRVIQDIPIFQDRLSGRVHSLVGVPLSLGVAELYLSKNDQFDEMLNLLEQENVFDFFIPMADARDEETSLLWLSNIERMVLNCFEGNGPEVSLLPHQLGLFSEALQERMKARKRLSWRLKWEFFSERKYWIKRVLVANGLAYNKTGLKVLEEKIDNRLNLEHHITALREKNWLKNFPVSHVEGDLKSWFSHAKSAIRLKLLVSSFPELREGLNPNKLKQENFKLAVQGIREALQTIPAQKEQWLQYLTPIQIRQIANHPLEIKNYIGDLQEHFDYLCEFDQLKDNQLPHEKDVLDKLHARLGNWESSKFESLFLNSIKLAWIDHIETKFPILRSVSSFKMEELERQLQEGLVEKEKLAQEILMLKAKEKMLENLEYNRLNNRISYRDLYHQVIKKRKIWPLRKLMNEFSDDLFKLIPCWLMSPESVSSIFPMAPIFDLVIFDEASQCFAEHGLPAIYRGRQIVVAGDDKQLQPNELYQIRWNEEEDTTPDTEVNSLLNLSSRYLKSYHLQGHYRSHALALIEFSNQHFYQNRLKLLPERNVFNQGEPAIRYQKVDGIWENNTNLIEAEAVVECVERLVSEDPEMEIGIVTFNAPQQMLIWDKLEEKAHDNHWQLPPDLFVKNIENVQGDERDVIIFSTGYAPDKAGKLRMQFGSLNIQGGENRLNVAVTRARKKILVYTSLWPEQLDIENTKNAGPALLKNYLAFAKDVSDGNFIPVLQDNEKPPAWYLNSRLMLWASAKFSKVTFGINTLPYCDLHFRVGKEYLGTILTDDFRFFESLSAKENHAYTPNLLENKNWPYFKVYSRNYWMGKGKLEETMLRFIGPYLEEKPFLF